MAARNGSARSRREPVVHRRGSFAGWIFGMLIALALGIAALIWLGALNLGFNEDESATPNVGVTVSDITSEPEEFFGTTVTVSGEVNEVIGPQAFTIGGEGFFGGDELLVLLQEDVELPAGLERDEDEAVLEDDIVQVTGVVGEFNVQEFEDKGDFVFDNERFEEFDGQPVVQAREVDLTPRD